MAQAVYRRQSETKAEYESRKWLQQAAWKCAFKAGAASNWLVTRNDTHVYYADKHTLVVHKVCAHNGDVLFADAKRPLVQHGNDAFHWCLSPDGKHLFVSEHGNVRQYDADTGRLMRSWPVLSNAGAKETICNIACSNAYVVAATPSQVHWLPLDATKRQASWTYHSAEQFRGTTFYGFTGDDVIVAQGADKLFAGFRYDGAWEHLDTIADVQRPQACTLTCRRITKSTPFVLSALLDNPTGLQPQITLTSMLRMDWRHTWLCCVALYQGHSG